ncbi:MAG: hypothetical protein HZB84_09360 [Deltaproteobacteria bacterium]|nr:hypothetical protein [Deltaproteobacteria bacterium]
MFKNIYFYTVLTIVGGQSIVDSTQIGDDLARKNHIVSSTLIASNDAGDSDNRKCKSLDVREFGLISDGSISAPWSEAALTGKFGPPCEIIDLGYVKSTGPDPRSGKTGSQADQYLEKKQYVYKGDYSNRATIITIIDGKVAKKERVDE